MNEECDGGSPRVVDGTGSNGHTRLTAKTTFYANATLFSGSFPNLSYPSSLRLPRLPTTPPRKGAQCLRTAIIVRPKREVFLGEPQQRQRSVGLAVAERNGSLHVRGHILSIDHLTTLLLQFHAAVNVPISC